MKRSEAEQLLGGYATGTLTADERSTLFTAALGQQAIFDALMDEEALRELLSDPAAKANLLAALASPATPKIIPFWRRTGVLGAAASLMVAATAGLAYLRSPNALPPVVHSETAQEPAAKAKETPATAVADAPAANAVAAPAANAVAAPGAKALNAPAAKAVAAPGAKRAAEASEPAQAPAVALRKAALDGAARSADQPRPEAPATEAPASAPSATAPPAPKPLAMPSSGVAVAQEDSARAKEKADFRRAEARDQLDKKAPARPAAAAATAALEGVAANRGDARERKAAIPDKDASRASGTVSGGVIGGGVGGAVSGVMSGLAPASPSSTAAKAKAEGDVATHAAAPGSAPTWALVAQPDGRTRVTVQALRGQLVMLLRRSPAGVEVLHLRLLDDRGQVMLQWRVALRLAMDDVLDLYLLNAPVTDPANLPETGPLDGFRARIYPAAK